MERKTKMNSKVKIAKVGQPCRHCGTPVIKRSHGDGHKFIARSEKRYQQHKTAYYYEYWFFCPKCRAIYTVESAKRFWQQ